MIYPDIPQNSLEKKIKKIIELCDKALNDYGEDAFEFGMPMSLEEIHNWEKTNNITIPNSYIEWLCFTRRCKIEFDLASFFEPKDFVIENEEKSYDVPDDCIVIGELGGAVISVCFSKDSGEIMVIEDDDIWRVDSFEEVLDWVIIQLVN